MLNCYSKKCFTGIIILGLMLAKTGYAAVRDTSATQAVKVAAGTVDGTVVNQEGRPIKDVTVSVKGEGAFVNTDANLCFK